MHIFLGVRLFYKGCFFFDTDAVGSSNDTGPASIANTARGRIPDPCSLNEVSYTDHPGDLPGGVPIDRSTCTYRNLSLAKYTAHSTMYQPFNIHEGHSEEDTSLVNHLGVSLSADPILYLRTWQMKSTNISLSLVLSGSCVRPSTGTFFIDTTRGTYLQ